MGINCTINNLTFFAGNEKLLEANNIYFSEINLYRIRSSNK